MDLEVLARLVGSVGFPIVVALWLLVRLDSILRKLTAAVQELTAEIHDLKVR